MKVVILCGGQGMRIRDVADDIPKPMIPLGGYPILWHIMKYYSSWGHHDFILCLGYKGQVIKDFFLNYESHTRDFTIDFSTPRGTTFHSDHQESNWRITCADTGLKSMTGARVKKIRRYLDDEKEFFLTYGDGVGDVNLDQLLKFHRSHGRIMTVTGVRPPGRFGEIMCESGGKVTEFNEKPQASDGRISGGFFVCRRELFDYLPDNDDLVFEVEPIRNLVRDGQMMVYEHDGFWQPMDTSRDFQLLDGLVAQGKAPWITW